MLEALVAAGVTAIIMSGVLAASVQLQRNFAAHKDYTDGVANQTLLLDYLAMDLRRARVVTALGDNQLTVEIPDYYTGNLNGRERRDPTIQVVTRANSRMREVYYGPTADASIQVRYYKQGNVIFREEESRGAFAIADHVDFEADYPLVPDPDNPGGHIADTGRVSLTVSFVPTVKRAGFTDAQREMFVFTAIQLRNLKAL